DRTGGRNQQRQDIEAAAIRSPQQPRALPGDPLHDRLDSDVRPRYAVDKWFSPDAEDRVVREQLRMRSAGHDSSTVAVRDVHNTVSVDAKRTERCGSQAFSRHR